MQIPSGNWVSATVRKKSPRDIYVRQTQAFRELWSVSVTFPNIHLLSSRSNQQKRYKKIERDYSAGLTGKVIPRFEKPRSLRLFVSSTFGAASEEYPLLAPENIEPTHTHKRNKPKRIRPCPSTMIRANFEPTLAAAPRVRLLFYPAERRDDKAHSNSAPGEFELRDRATAKC